jgi:hypothetical protein
VAVPCDSVSAARHPRVIVDVRRPVVWVWQYGVALGVKRLIRTRHQKFSQPEILLLHML